ncbi:C2 calcium-dependent domain-containing protein 4C-like [Scyliorhinus canicula]|uniref:C2 calcium-dependent domain-containing protein 4C-like n=1 Tax=Scyliorhinus canicula TaxID=7830 RepID=UPI0018F55791|nr:C2 calcium-dependent domain-containing protein 4C-like [Scyliorhinus canicula]XP_038633459.1 C2 calcium-dependent domain-containing protein 4C-like [Scyliorhinus canicula]XP_038633460.1 C2 calcium-dependent domain-containing protein 4C-like [Scyliorhinus canicula]
MWFFDKIRGSVENNGNRAGDANGRDKGCRGSLFSNVLTPDKIPDFFIPPTFASSENPAAEQPEKRLGRSNLKASSSEQVLVSRKPRGSPRLKGKRSTDSSHLLKVANRHIIQIESADDTNSEDVSEASGNTNYDPQSQSAMSLPYMPVTQTSYGFSTLTESPHTRRKESLFHVDHGSPVTSPSSPRKRSPSQKGIGDTQHLNTPDFSLSLASNCKYHSGGDSDTASSAESSPFNSPLLSRSVSGASLLKMFSHENLAKHCKPLQSFTRNSSLSTDECSSTDASPCVSRRVRCPTPPAGGSAAPQGVLPLSLLRYQDRVLKEHTIRLNKGGAIRLSAEYDCTNARLRIRIITAEDLYDKTLDNKSINCCVILYLTPGKVQKQRSTIIKNSRNPIFNEDFFFDALPLDEFKRAGLKLKVVNKASSLKRDVILGEKELKLSLLLPFF